MCLPKMCCCCIGLRTGVLAIAISTLVGAFLLLIPTIYLLSDVHPHDSFSQLITFFIYLIFGTLATSLLIDIVSSSILLYGVLKESIVGLKSYIVIKAIHFVLAATAGIFFLALFSQIEPFSFFSTGDPFADRVSSWVTLVLLVCILLGFKSYFWLVSLSYLKHLQKKQDYVDIDMHTTVEMFEP